jgi:hypothetical protein
VEDEPLLRIYAADIVKQAGFQPVEADHAEQALEFWRGAATSAQS